MRSRWFLAGIAVALVVGAIGWRAAGGDEERRSSYAGELTLLDGVVPARAGITLPPGTPIGAGLEVAQGSYLLGGALPYLYSTMHGGDPIRDDGFEAHLLLTEPIRDVVDRYRVQAVAAGFDMTPVWCISDEGALRCTTECQSSCGFPYETGYEHGRRLGISGRQGPPLGGLQPPVSYLSITYRHIGEPPFPTEAISPPPEVTDERGSVPADWPSLPNVGERIYSFNDFEVAEGTVLLAHGLGVTEQSADTTAIFEVVDDIDTVIDRFASQPRFHPEDDLHRETLRRDGNRIDIVYWLDGHGQSFIFYDLADGPTVLVLWSSVSD